MVYRVKYLISNDHEQMQSIIPMYITNIDVCVFLMAVWLVTSDHFAYLALLDHGPGRSSRACFPRLHTVCPQENSNVLVVDGADGLVYIYINYIHIYIYICVCVYIGTRLHEWLWKSLAVGNPGVHGFSIANLSYAYIYIYYMYGIYISNM